MRGRKTKATKGSGNVFADLGLPNPEQEMLKARLTLQIFKLVKERGLTQAQAGEVLLSAAMRDAAAVMGFGHGQGRGCAFGARINNAAGIKVGVGPRITEPERETREYRQAAGTQDAAPHCRNGDARRAGLIGRDVDIHILLPIARDADGKNVIPLTIDCAEDAASGDATNRVLA